MARPTPRTRGRGRGRSDNKGGGALTLMVGAILAVTALPLCIVCAAGLAPAIVAGLTDRHPKRYLLRTVAVLNLAGMVLPVMALLHSGLTVASAALVLLDPYRWLWMYGAAALGWLCYLAAPSLAILYVEHRDVRAERELRERTAALVEEWGEEVTGRKRERKAAA